MQRKIRKSLDKMAAGSDLDSDADSAAAAPAVTPKKVVKSPVRGAAPPLRPTPALPPSCKAPRPVEPLTRASAHAPAAVR